ncbi:hypothetical protein C8R46DRAFT_1079667 [Mycena filopes]|nr:hypothetical protein C8R46DRAFT_1079667 [Mycena filopes]
MGNCAENRAAMPGILNTTRRGSDIQPVVQVMLDETQDLVSREKNPMMSFRKIVVDAGPCPNTEWKEDVEIGFPLPFEAEKGGISGVDGYVTKGCLQICFVEKAPRPRLTDAVYCRKNRLVDEMAVFDRDSVVERGAVWIGEVMNTPPFRAVLLGDRAQRREEGPDRRCGIRDVDDTAETNLVLEIPVYGGRELEGRRQRRRSQGRRRWCATDINTQMNAVPQGGDQCLRKNTIWVLQ